MWIDRAVETARPPRFRGRGDRVRRRTRSDSCAVTHVAASQMEQSPSNRKIATSVASHSRAALSTIASKTGWTSVGELAITRRISLGRRLLLERLGQLAVPGLCSSVNRRTFSMAITAWSAKVFEERDLLVRERADSVRATQMTPMASPRARVATPAPSGGYADLRRRATRLRELRRLPSRSSTWIVCRSSTARPATEPRIDRDAPADRH